MTKSDDLSIAANKNFLDQIEKLLGLARGTDFHTLAKSVGLDPHADFSAETLARFSKLGQENSDHDIIPNDTLGSKSAKTKPSSSKKIITIDISPIFDPVEDIEDSFVDLIGSTMRNHGCFFIKGHNIDRALINAVYSSAKKFFSLSDTEKINYYIGDSLNHRGYVPFTEKGDYADEMNRNYEAFDIALELPHDDPDYLAGNLLLGPNVWPRLEGFRETISSYYRDVAQISRRLCATLEKYLELPPGAMTGQMSKPISQLRLLHFVRASESIDKSSVNMGAHTDYECLSIEHADSEGQQVMGRSGDWIDVPVKKTALLVRAGDMMEAWTNGIFRSTPHRVLNLHSERYSIPYFVAPNYDTMIEPFPSLITPENPRRYEPFKAGLHLERMLLRDFPYLRERRGDRVWSPKTEHAGKIKNPFEARFETK